MRLEGTVYQGDLVINRQTLTLAEDSSSFTKRLDRTLLALTKALNVPIPIWLQKNTREFTHFRQTMFFPEQFAETVNFSYLQIKLIEN